MPKLSLCMILKNEGDFLEACLKAHAGLVDEFVLVDTGSTDNTPDTIQKYAGRILHFEWCDDFSAARNYSLSQATGDWILVLDADEILSPDDQTRIRELINSDSKQAYSFIQRTYTDNTQLFGFTRNDPANTYTHGTLGYIDTDIVRLIPNQADLGLRYVQRIHEGIEYTDPKKKPVRTSIVLHHYGYLKSPDKLFAKQKLYHQLESLRIRENPNDAEGLRQYAAASLAENHFAEALRAFEQSLIIEPFHPTALFGAAVACFRQSRFGEALSWIAKSPSNSLILNLKGAVLMEQGENEKARIIFEEVIKNDPTQSDAQYNLGVCLMRLKRYPDALNAYQKALLLNPRHTGSLFNAALILHAFDKKEAAINLMQAVVQIDANDEQAREKLSSWVKD